MTDNPSTPARSYGCTFGCGNPYDYVIVSVSDNSVEMLCVPCYVRLAADMVAAIVEEGNPDIAAALAMVGLDNAESVPGPSGAPRGKNAPVGTTDPDILVAYESVITSEELPDDFK